MPTYSDEGIVLRRVDYGESDRVLTVLTRQHGKLGVMARGVRKAGSRLASHTDLFSRSRMQLASGRGELEVLAQAQLSSVPAPLRDARRMGCAALCAELADRVMENHHPDSEVFDFLAGALIACGDPAHDARAAVAWFARRMIDRLGYAPQLHDCAGCGRKLPESPAHFSAAAGGLLCDRCAANERDTVRCSVRVIKVLRTVASGDDGLFARLKLDRSTLDTLETVVERELAQHVDRRLRSLEVLRALG